MTKWYGDRWFIANQVDGTDTKRICDWLPSACQERMDPEAERDSDKTANKNTREIPLFLGLQKEGGTRNSWVKKGKFFLPEIFFLFLYAKSPHF